MTKRITFRPADGQVERLEAEMEQSGLSQSALVRELIEEGLREREIPGIYFQDTPSGRQPAVAGTGLLVREVITQVRDYEGDTEQVLDDHPSLNKRKLRSALVYADRYEEEIEASIEENDSMTESDLADRYPHLFNAA